MEGYASDRFWSVLSQVDGLNNAIKLAGVVPRIADISEVLAYLPNIRWYSRSDVSEPVDRLITSEPTLKGMADQMKDIITVGWFNLVNDLVGGHDNLVWYADPDVVTGANTLIQRYRELEDIADIKEELSVLADNKDTLDWYARSDVSSILSNLTQGKLPEIEKPAKFKADMDVLGKLNQLKPSADFMKDRLNTLEFRVKYDFMFAGIHYSDDRTYRGRDGIRSYLDWLRARCDSVAAGRGVEIIDVAILLGVGMRALIHLFTEVIKKLESEWI